MKRRLQDADTHGPCPSQTVYETAKQHQSRSRPLYNPTLMLPSGACSVSPLPPAANAHLRHESARQLPREDCAGAPAQSEREGPATAHQGPEQTKAFMCRSANDSHVANGSSGDTDPDGLQAARKQRRPEDVMRRAQSFSVPTSHSSEENTYATTLQQTPGFCMRPELPPKLRKKIRIIQPISSTWEADALQQATPTQDASNRPGSATTSSEDKPQPKQTAGSDNSDNKPGNDGRKSAAAVVEPPMQFPHQTATIPISSSYMQAHYQQRKPDARCTQSTRQANDPAPAATPAVPTRTTGVSAPGPHHPYPPSNRPVTAPLSAGEQQAPLGPSRGQVHHPTPAPARMPTSTAAPSASPRPAPWPQSPSAKPAGLDLSDTAQALNSLPIDSAIVLGQIQGQLGDLYQWYVSNRDTHLNQAKAYVGQLDSLLQARLHTSRSAAEANAVTKAIHTAMQIIRASTDIEVSSRGMTSVRAPAPQ